MAIRAYGKSVQSYTAWQAETGYVLTNYCVPTEDNDMCYECTTAGTSDLDEPTWLILVGQRVSDGTVVWTCREKTPAANPLTVTLELGNSRGCTFKEIWVKSNSEAEFLIWGSYDGVNWRYLSSLTVPSGERDENHQSFVTVYPYIGVGTSVSANNEIEILAGA